jgi:hypothetical protein
VEVHYVRSGGGQAAAVVAADPAFARVLAERAAVVPEAAPGRLGEFYRRELPPPGAVVRDITGLGLLVAGSYAGLCVRVKALFRQGKSCPVLLTLALRGCRDRPRAGNGESRGGNNGVAGGRDKRLLTMLLWLSRL